MKTEDVALRSYFGYVGSKSSIADVLVAMMPPEAFHSYCEVFAGGAGLFLGKPKAKIQTILNDLDPDVHNVHATVAAQPEAVMAELETLRPSRAVFERLRDLRDEPDWWDLTDARRAAAFIYLAKCSVNANLRSFSVSSKVRSNFNPHLDLMPYSRKFDGVLFERLDWHELLNRLVLKPSQVTLALYLDPPYVVADSRHHYRFNFNAVQHLLLARVLAQINERNNGRDRNVKVMVSYDDDPDGFVRSLYRKEFGWHVHDIKICYAAQHQADRDLKELVITNYPLPESTVSQMVA